MKQNGIRAELDLRSQTLNKKIRDAQVQKIPYLGVLGKTEMYNNTLSIRNRDSGGQEELPAADFIRRLRKEDSEKSLTLTSVK